MMSQSDFLKNAGRWGGSDVATLHYRAAVLSNADYVKLNIMQGGVRCTLAFRRFVDRGTPHDFVRRRRGASRRARRRKLAVSATILGTPHDGAARRGA
jgi:hypothetical protein